MDIDLDIDLDRSDTKLMFSSANDGDLVAWGSGGGVIDRIKVSLLTRFQNILALSDLFKFDESSI